jgi:hypothetical protein
VAEKKKKWIQKAAVRMQKKGTEGSFTAWCKRQGFAGVTAECIAKGLKSRDPSIRRKANFARNVRK